MPANNTPQPGDTPGTPNGVVTILEPGNPGVWPGEAGAPPDHLCGSKRYQLIEVIARGGMGVVWRARDLLLNRVVGLKTLLSTTPPDEVVARFRAEAHITAQLQHPNIPPVHDIGVLPDGRPFIVMKLIKGNTLAKLLQNRADPADDSSRFLSIFERVVHGVAYSHAHKVIHRDLKPLNVMVGAHDEVQVMDWGLAKVQSDNPGVASLPTVDPTVIQTSGAGTWFGSVLGTWAYMPQEQALGRINQIDSRSDVFSLGGILCEILTGKPPYVDSNRGSPREQAEVADLKEATARLDACGAEPELIALCKWCLAPERDGRPLDAGTVAETLARIRREAERRAREELASEAGSAARMGLAQILLVIIMVITALSVVFDIVVSVTHDYFGIGSTAISLVLFGVSVIGWRWCHRYGNEVAARRELAGRPEKQ